MQALLHHNRNYAEYNIAPLIIPKMLISNSKIKINPRLSLSDCQILTRWSFSTKCKFFILKN